MTKTNVIFHSICCFNFNK